jgi:heme o synthase
MDSAISGERAQPNGKQEPQPKQNRLVRDYLQLAKPRIVILLIFTTVTAMVVAARGQLASLNGVIILATVVGGSLAAAGASALNQYIDRDMDAKMARTRNRPIPSGRVAPLNALLYGLGLVAWSVLILGFLVNWLAALLAFIGAIYYVVIYTLLLKRNTVLNILIGGGAGAMPVLVGWAAVTGSLAPQAFILFAIIFYWTPPHSWALALLVNADYTKAQVPMMPVAHGEQAARVQILLYSLQMIALSLLPVPFRMLGLFYLGAVVLLGGGMIYESVRLLQQKTNAAARRTYKYSTFYLALLFLAMIIDQLVFRGLMP